MRRNSRRTSIAFLAHARQTVLALAPYATYRYGPPWGLCGGHPGERGDSASVTVEPFVNGQVHCEQGRQSKSSRRAPAAMALQPSAIPRPSSATSPTGASTSAPQQRSISTVPRVSQLGDERTAIGRPSVLPAAPIQVASARVSFSCSGRTAYRSWSVGAVAKAIWPKKRA
jgi:hypothetical protein